MIEVNKLSGFDKESILYLLDINERNYFTIVIPKSTVLFRSSSSSISIEYVEIAYAGQRLKDISELFDYNHVDPAIHESFIFRVATSDLDGLAQVILDISYGYGNDEEDQFVFSELVSEFEDNLSDLNIACTDYIEYYYEYKQELE